MTQEEMEVLERKLNELLSLIKDKHQRQLIYNVWQIIDNEGELNE